MPNRMIKDSIHTSESINALSDFQFRLWVNLITYVDDFGRGDARPAVIKGTCFPLRDRMTNRDIEAALKELAGAGCVCLYEVDGKPYLYFPNWESHQRIRQKVSKYPAPTDCGNSPQIAADCGEVRPETKKKPKPKRETKDEEEDACAREEDLDPLWIEFVREYEQNIGLIPTSYYALEKLQSDFEILGPQVMKEAIRITALKNASNPHNFLGALCQEWIRKGVKTVEQAKAAVMDHERSRKGGARNAIDLTAADGGYRKLFDGEDVI